VSSLDDLRDDLWKRWRFHLENPVLEESAVSGATTQYARVPLFDLKKYTPGKFPPGARVFAQPIHGIDNWVYLLDERKRPVTMSTRHSANRTSWRGSYRYAADEAEYVEFCLETGVPAEYSRAVFRDGRATSFQRLIINGRGSYPIWRGHSAEKAQRLREIRSNPGDYFIWVEEYDTRDGRVRSGRGFTEGFGGFPQYTTLSYAYSDDGRLQRVIRHYEGGRQSTEFAARAKISTRELCTRLSQQIAERAIEALANVSLGAPLAGVQLLYRSVTDYVPGLCSFTEGDNLFDSIRDRYIELRDEDFEPEMADLQQRIADTERYQICTKMLRDAAKLLTKLNAGQRDVAPGFVAFAIDWEFEGHELAKILRDCGADARTLRIWRQRGWLK
jgi:hypothetical protein